MAIRKIEMRPPGTGDYADILYPKSSADIVVSTDGTVQGDIDALNSGKANVTHNHTKSQITDFPALGTVASKNTGTTSGTIPILGTGGKLDVGILPAIAISDTFVVASQALMLALTAEVGDIAVRTDLNKSFILKTSPSSTLANWQELLTPTDSVSSVAGKTGAVTLSSGDVGLGNVTNESKATMFTNSSLTGTPTAPTAAVSTNNTQIATTAFVKSQSYLTGITKAQIEAQLTGAITSHTHTGLAPALHAELHVGGGADAIPNFTSTVSGLVPSSGGGTLKYLRADGSWIVPPQPTIPTIISAFTNDVGYITKSVTIGSMQPSDGTIWYKEI